MKPILAFKALNHKLIHMFDCMRLLAIAIAIKEVLIVIVIFILVIFLVFKQTTGEWHSTITTVAFKIQSWVEFNNFMTFMAGKHTAQTETMRLNVFQEARIAWKSRLYQISCGFIKILYDFIITCKARVNLLVNIAIFISAFLCQFYKIITCLLIRCLILNLKNEAKFDTYCLWLVILVIFSPFCIQLKIRIVSFHLLLNFHLFLKLCPLLSFAPLPHQLALSQHFTDRWYCFLVAFEFPLKK